MNIDSRALLALFKMPEEIPACDEGMELARAFLVSCGDAVAKIEDDDDAALRFAFNARWRAFVQHLNACDKCNEV